MNGNTENATLLLPESLDLAASERFLDSVRQHMSGGGPLRMDASAVRTLTLPCAQIILAAVRDGESVAIKDPSEAFVGAFDDLGLDWRSCLEHGQPPDQDQPQRDGGGFDGSEVQLAGDGDTKELSVQADLQTISESAMSKRILTIDDSKTMRDMLMLTLAGAGFDVIQAVDGQDGLDVLVGKKVDVIITDINMPRMDGYEVIRHLRRNPEHKSTPILVLTTESEAEKKNLAREAGATGWMVKPFDPERLVATVLKVAP